MGEFYGKMIQQKKISHQYGKVMTLELVPKLWRKRTEDWLAANPLPEEVEEN